MSGRCGDDQGQDADHLDARIETLEQTMDLGKFLRHQRVLHGVNETGKAALKKIHRLPVSDRSCLVTCFPHRTPALIPYASGE